MLVMGGFLNSSCYLRMYQLEVAPFKASNSRSGEILRRRCVEDIRVIDTGGRLSL